MAQQELLRSVIRALDAEGIPYMVTGSLASSFHGEPRSSHDIDLVVVLDRAHADALLTHFVPPAYHLDRDSMLEAIFQNSMFNLVDVLGGDKVDFWMLTGEPFDRSRFSRKRLEKIAGQDVVLSSPEDTILAKLRWAQLAGGSEKQLGDAQAIFEVQGAALDLAYVEEWVERLGLQSLWQELRRRAGNAP